MGENLCQPLLPPLPRAAVELPALAYGLREFAPPFPGLAASRLFPVENRPFDAAAVLPREEKKC